MGRKQAEKSIWLLILTHSSGKGRVTQSLKPRAMDNHSQRAGPGPQEGTGTLLELLCALFSSFLSGNICCYPVPTSLLCVGFWGKITGLLGSQTFTFSGTILQGTTPEGPPLHQTWFRSRGPGFGAEAWWLRRWTLGVLEGKCIFEYVRVVTRRGPAGRQW